MWHYLGKGLIGSITVFQVKNAVFSGGVKINIFLFCLTDSAQFIVLHCVKLLRNKDSLLEPYFEAE